MDKEGVYKILDQLWEQNEEEVRNWIYETYLAAKGRAEEKRKNQNR